VTGQQSIVADNLSKAGWSLGWVSAIGSNGETRWIVNAHRNDGKRFVVRADEKLTAFVELESAIRAPSNDQIAIGWLVGEILCADTKSRRNARVSPSVLTQRCDS
jgi:hypothetical protein